MCERVIAAHRSLVAQRALAAERPLKVQFVGIQGLVMVKPLGNGMSKVVAMRKVMRKAIMMVVCLVFASCGGEPPEGAFSGNTSSDGATTQTGSATQSGAISQTGSTETESVHRDFFDNLSALCGEMFSGAATYPKAGPATEDHPLVGTPLRTHISECTDTKIRIELIRGEDYWHGAWVLEMRDAGLHLFHDHLGEVRTPQDLEASGDAHGYGGFANDEGTALRQIFPADNVTAEMLPAAATNVWMMELDPENNRFVYDLKRHGEPRFRAELTQNLR